VFTFNMRLIHVTSLLLSALFVAAEQNATTANELIQELTQLPDCAVCIMTKSTASHKQF
jgi:hypothetical protein